MRKILLLLLTFPLATAFLAPTSSSSRIKAKSSDASDSRLLPRSLLVKSDQASQCENGAPELSQSSDLKFQSASARSPGWLRRTFPAVPWKCVPNWLTYARCVAIPILVAVFYVPNRHRLAATVFTVASLTDWLDGYLARRWDVASSFGGFLDPVVRSLISL